MSNDNKIISAERFFNAQQLKKVLPEMEEERVKVRQTILSIPAADTEALDVLSRIYDAYMGEFTCHVRRLNGGLQPYSFRYTLDKDMASRSNPYQIDFCHRDILTKFDTPIAQFTVVRLPSDDDYLVHAAPDVKGEAEITASVLELNNLYVDHVQTNGLGSSICASLFYLPYLAALGSLVKSSGDGPSCHELVIDPPEPLSKEELFFPFDFFFDTDDPDPSNHFMRIRVGRVAMGVTALAVEALFCLNNLRIAAASEGKYTDAAPPGVTRH